MPNWCSQSLTFRGTAADILHVLYDIDAFPVTRTGHGFHPITSTGTNEAISPHYAHKERRAPACWTTTLKPAIAGFSEAHHAYVFSFEVVRPDTALLGHACFGCSSTRPAAGAKFSRCARCKAACFCGRACQRAAWVHHRKVCHRGEGGQYAHFDFLALEGDAAAGHSARAAAEATEAGSASPHRTMALPLPRPTSADLKATVLLCVKQIDVQSPHELLPRLDAGARFAHRVLSSADADVVSCILSFVGVPPVFEVTVRFCSKWSPAYGAVHIQRIAAHYSLRVRYIYAEQGNDTKGSVACEPSGVLVHVENGKLTTEQHGYWQHDDDDAEEHSKRMEQAERTDQYYRCITTSG